MELDHDEKMRRALRSASKRVQRAQHILYQAWDDLNEAKSRAELAFRYDNDHNKSTAVDTITQARDTLGDLDTDGILRALMRFVGPK